MDICGWRLLRAGHSTPTQHQVQFSLTFQVLWWWWNLQSTSSHPCPPPVGNRSDKILHWAMTLLPLLQAVFSFSSCASRHSFTPCWCVPVALGISPAQQPRQWLLGNKLTVSSCSADSHSWKQAVTVPLSLCSLSLSCSPSSAIICLIRRARQFRICTRSCPCYSPAEAN